MRALREAFTRAEWEGRPIVKSKLSEIAALKAAVVSARVPNVPVLVGVSERAPGGTTR